MKIVSFLLVFIVAVIGVFAYRAAYDATGNIFHVYLIGTAVGGIFALLGNLK